MTMVPAPKLSKPHLIFYGGCGAASPEVMSRFGDGCSSGAGAGAGAGGGGGYNNINGNHHHHHDDATTTADNIITNKVDKSSNNNNNNNNNKVISSVLGFDLGIGHPHHHHHNINIVMADEQQQQQQQQQQQHSRNSNNSVNDDDGDGSGGVIRQRSNSVAKTREDDDVMDSSSWLQLGLGGGGGTHLGSSSPHQVESTAPRTTAGGLMLELNLGGGFHHHRHNQTTPFQMPGLESRVPQTPPHGSVGGGSVSGPTTFVSPHHQILISSLSPQSQLYLLHQQQQQQQQQLQLQLQQQQLGWGLMNQRTTMSASMSPSSSSSLPPQQVLLPAAQSGIPPFFTRPFTSSGASVDDAPDSEFRLIHPPPRRPHSGIWFSLHASLHQSKEPFLPQVSKNFLRIKDGRMTVRLVMKYLANKLGLDNESEVEIRCRGQQLVPFLTLQHVRDNIWSPREAAVTLLPDSSTSDHLMVLNYGRSTTSSAYNYLT